MKKENKIIVVNNKIIPEFIGVARGFTLIELLVVVLIISILVAVAVPQYRLAVAKSQYVTLKQVVDGIAKAQEMYYLENDDYANSFDKLAIDMPEGYTDLSEEKGNPYYSYDWGYCSFQSKQLRCQHSLLKMQYQRYLQHSNNPNRRTCVALKTIDLTSLSNRVCQNETFATPKIWKQQNYTSWGY